MLSMENSILMIKGKFTEREFRATNNDVEQIEASIVYNLHSN